MFRIDATLDALSAIVASDALQRFAFICGALLANSRAPGQL
jgi:hypothetical protein